MTSGGGGIGHRDGGGDRRPTIAIDVPTPRISNYTASPYFSSSPEAASATTPTTATKSSRKSGTGSGLGKSRKQSSGDGRRHDNGAARKTQTSQYSPQQQQQQQQHSSRHSSRQHQRELHQRQRPYSEEHRQALSSPVEREPYTPPREPTLDSTASKSHSHGQHSHTPSQTHSSRHQQQQYSRRSPSRHRHRDLSSHYYTPPRSKPPKSQSSHDKISKQERSNSKPRQRERHHASPSSEPVDLPQSQPSSRYHHGSPSTNSNYDPYTPPPRQHRSKQRVDHSQHYHLDQHDHDHQTIDHHPNPERVDYDEQYYRYNNLEPSKNHHATTKRKVLKKSQSAGVAEMASSSGNHYNNNTFFSNHSSHQVGQHHYIDHPIIGNDLLVDNGEDNGSKKSKQSILSRAGKKIKKRLIGKSKEPVMDKKELLARLVAEGQVAAANDDGRVEYYGRVASDPTGVVAPDHRIREGRDPSPTNDDNRRYVNMQGDEGAWVYSGENGRYHHRHHKQDNGIRYEQDHQDLDMPSFETENDENEEEGASHDSTLSTNFTPVTSENVDIPENLRDDLLPRVEKYLATPPIIDDNYDDQSRLKKVGVRPRLEVTAQDKDDEDANLNGHEAEKPGEIQSDLASISQQPSQDMMGQYLMSKDEEIRSLREAAEKAKREKDEAEKKLDDMTQKSQHEEQESIQKKKLLSSQQRHNMLTASLQKTISWQVQKEGGLKNLQVTSAPRIALTEEEGTKYGSPPKNFAEKKQFLQNSLNFGQFSKHQKHHPQTVTEKERPDVIETPTDIQSSTMAASKTKPVVEGAKKPKALHANLMAEMMSKIEKGGLEVEEEVPQHVVSARKPWESRREDEEANSSALRRDTEEQLKAVSRQKEELKRENDNLSSELERLKQTLKEQERKHNEEMERENNNLSSELQHMKQKLSEQEEEMDSKVGALERELQKQEKELKEMSQREDEVKSIEASSDAKYNEYVVQLASDLDAYKGECASYRERILQKERDHAKMENLLYKERKKVLSLESENQMLLNIAEDNASQATHTKRSKESELTVYREQCDKYRQRVLGLERNLLSAEGALEASGQIATSLEQDKKSLSSTINQLRSNNAALDAKNESLQSKLAEKEAEMKSFQADLSELKTKWSQAEANMAEAKDRSTEDKKTIGLLEEENASLLQKLDESKLSLEKLQVSADRSKQLEEENNRLQKQNEDLMTKHIEMSKEVDDAQGLASNTQRLHKMMSDNESFISKLQDDLSQARTSHLEALQNTRGKYSAEINSLTEKLAHEVELRRKVDTKNNELEDKIMSMERAYTELEHMGSHQTKSQSEQLMKMMEHADDLRKKHMQCQQENAVLKQKLSEQSHANERQADELRGKLVRLEKEKMEASNSLTAVNAELVQLRKGKKRDLDGLEQIIKQKDDALVKLQSDFSGYAIEKTRLIDSLKSKNRQLVQDLDDTTSSRNALKIQAHDVRQHFLGAMNSMRVEKTTLLSDVQSRILEERVAMMTQLKDMVRSYGKQVESHNLEQSMEHSVAMSTIRSEKRDIERLLDSEKTRTNNLETKLDKIVIENQALKNTINSACAKVSISDREDLIDAIDDILIEKSDAKIQVRTLEVDVSHLNSTIASLEHENDQLSTQLERNETQVTRLESELDRERNALRLQTEEYTFLQEKLENLKTESDNVIDQMRKAFDADRRSQDNAVGEIILAKEEALLHQQALQKKVEELTENIQTRDERIREQGEKLVDLQSAADDLNQERDNLSSKYEECQTQLAVLLDKTLASKDKADELMNHYMKIEDELRRQLQSVQSEKEGLENKLSLVEKASDSTMEEFFREKNNLTSNLASKEDLIEELETQLEEMKNSKDQTEDQLSIVSNELANLKQGYNKEKKDLNSTIASREESTRELEKQIADLEKGRVEAEKQLDILSKEIADLKQGFESEKNDLVSTLALKEKIIRDFEEQMNDVKRSRAQAESEFNTVSSELANLKQDNAELKERHESVCKDRDNSVELSSDALRRVTAERDSLAQRVQALDTDLEALNSSQISKDATIEKLHSTLETERQAHRSAQDNLQAEIDSLTTEKSIHTLQVENLATSLEKMNSTIEVERQNHSSVTQALQNELRIMTSRAEGLASTLADLQSSQYTKDDMLEELKSTLDEERVVHSDTLDDLQGQIDRLVEEKHSLSRQVNELDANILELKSSNQDGIESMKSTIEEERLVHADEVADLRKSFDSEMGQQQMKSQMQVDKINLLDEEAKQMREEVNKLNNTNKKQEQQIAQLKDSLKDALEEALRLGSKISSEQAKVAELSHSMSSYEEENVNLKQTLQSSQSEVDEITTVLSSQELDRSKLKLSLRKITAEKERLEGELSDKEKKLFETMNTLTHFELKLTKAEQERDEQSERSRTEIARLQNDISSLEMTQEEKEQELISQIVALKKDCEADDFHNELYKQLLEKMEDKEVYYNSRVRSMKKDMDSLRQEIKSLNEDNKRLSGVNREIASDKETLAEEKNRLTLVNDYILAENSSLAENLTSLESKLAGRDDENSITSGASKVSHLKRTASELETTIRAIKKHHSETVKKLQNELDDARKRLKKYERRVQDLTKLIEENSFVIESLHKKIRGKKRHSSSGTTPPHPSNSIESGATDLSMVSEI